MQLSHTYMIVLSIKLYIFFRAIKTLHLTNTTAAVLVRQKGRNRKHPVQSRRSDKAYTTPLSVHTFTPRHTQLRTFRALAICFIDFDAFFFH